MGLIIDSLDVFSRCPLESWGLKIQDLKNALWAVNIYERGDFRIFEIRAFVKLRNAAFYFNSFFICIQFL